MRTFLRLGLITAGVLGVVFTLLGELFPREITALFIAATPEVLDAAPQVTRLYFPVFLFMGINITATYYLQSVRRGRPALIISVLRSVVLSGALLLVLPEFLGLTGALIALPVSELITVAVAAGLMARAVINTK